MSKWMPIDTCPEEGPAVLLYNPEMDDDEEYPGHSFHVSNRAFVACGNAGRAGFTHWMPIPSAPKRAEI